LPVIQVSGRNDPPLRLRGRQGVPVVIVPLALTTVLEEQAGLFAFQLRHQDDVTLELVVPQVGAHAQASLRQACKVLQRFFALQGAARIRIHTCSGVNLPRGSSGKAARVLSI
jgi:hypothetical protein